MLNVKKLLTKILGAIKTESATPFTGVAVYRFGALISMRINMAGRTYSTGWNSLGTLPSDYRPTTRVDFWAIDNNTVTGTASPCLISINPTSGAVQFYKYASNSTGNIQLMGNIAYWGGTVKAVFSRLSAILCRSLKGAM